MGRWHVAYGASGDEPIHLDLDYTLLPAARRSPCIIMITQCLIIVRNVFIVLTSIIHIDIRAKFVFGTRRSLHLA